MCHQCVSFWALPSAQQALHSGHRHQSQPSRRPAHLHRTLAPHVRGLLERSLREDPGDTRDQSDLLKARGQGRGKDLRLDSPV